jgi:hypothetical protein
MADGVFVGHQTGFTTVESGGVALRDYRFVVMQKVKGDFKDAVTVRIPAPGATGGQLIPAGVDAGVLMNQAKDGTWFTTRCGITDPGAVLAEVDVPKGNAVKLLVGIVILLSVVGYSVRRVKRKNASTTLPQ